MQDKRVAILGGGNMGGAIARGIYQNEGALGIASSQIVIAEPDQTKHAGLREGNNCTIVAAAVQALKLLASDGMIVIAVKPQLFPGLATELGSIGSRLAISVMAGCTTARIHQAFGGRIVRSMPNLPLTVGQGMTAICAGPGATPRDMAFAKDLFSRLGRCIELDESLMDAMTAVASSGAAYVFYLAEAMINGAVAVGFDGQVAQDIVRQTIAGAASMLLKETKPPEQMRAAVTSKGGTTAAAVQVLDSAQVLGAFSRAIVAARDRGRELST